MTEASPDRQDMPNVMSGLPSALNKAPGQAPTQLRYATAGSGFRPKAGQATNACVASEKSL